MKRKIISENAVLRKLDITDFRHITKDKVVEFISMYSNMDIEVVKSAIAQFPDFANMMEAVIADYKISILTILESECKSAEETFKIYQGILEALQNELERSNLTIEERKDIIEKLFEIKNSMEFENEKRREFFLNITKNVGCVVVTAAAFSIVVLGGRGTISIPSSKKIS